MFVDELIGECKSCGKKVYCHNGFLDGVTEGNELFCFDCTNHKEEKSSLIRD